MTIPLSVFGAGWGVSSNSLQGGGSLVLTWLLLLFTLTGIRHVLPAPHWAGTVGQVCELPGSYLTEVVAPPLSSLP
jgi:hypothetical protein